MDEAAGGEAAVLTGPAAIVTGSYWNSFFLVLIFANTVRAAQAAVLVGLRARSLVGSLCAVRVGRLTAAFCCFAGLHGAVPAVPGGRGV